MEFRNRGDGHAHQTYAYDAHGNRQSIPGSTSYTYEPGTMRLASHGASGSTSTFGYDNNGNLKTAPNAVYGYTLRNMLESAQVVGGTTSYVYDADDWRAKKSGQGTHTYYIRGLDQQVLTEWSNPGPSGQTRDYIYAGSRLIAVVKRATSADVTDLYFTIVPDGPAVDVPFTAPGQRALLTFDGLADRRMSVLSSVSDGCLNWPLAILKPDGTTLVSKTGCASEFLDPVSLPVSGTSTIVIDPNGTSTGTASVTLHDVVDITGPIEPDGTAVPVALWKPGQKAYLTFDGLAGRRMSVLSSVSDGCLNWPLAILKPDGTTLVSKNGCGSVFVDPVSLPVSGTYTIVIDPNWANVGTATVRLYDVVDITGPIEPDGAAVPVALWKPGQKAYLTFDGLAGRRMSVLSTVGSGACLNWPLAILKPDGTTLVSKNGCGTEFLDPVSLPVSGTYTIVIDPNGASVETASVRLYDVVDLTGALVISGASVPLALSDVGQVARLTFAGASGQSVTVRLTSNTTSTTLVQLLRPDGTVLTSRSSSSTNFNLTTQTLPTAGTYMVVVDPLNANTGTITVAVTNP